VKSVQRIKSVLIIDDDLQSRDAIVNYLAGNSDRVYTAGTGAAGVEICSKNSVDVVLLDQDLPDGEGRAFCPEILRHNEHAKIIFLTENPSFDVAVKAIRAGAYDYLSKPVEPEALKLAVARAFKTAVLEKVAQIETYKAKKESREAVIVGSSQAIGEVARMVDLAASSSAPVLITGETGTGKNVVASAIHYRSDARQEAFITINCAALPESLIEAELFGHVKGAFTGADSAKRGIFEMAEGGTLLLDEIGEMPIHMQTKLLGVLDSKKVRRIGGEAFRPVNVRVLAATSTNLEYTLDDTFRRDLYYRLSVIRLHVPPLRERREDIPELCEHLLAKLVSGLAFELPEAEMQKLMFYDWPGNVRELKNILERACILGEEQVIKPSELLGGPGRPAGRPDEPTVNSLAEVEKNHIRLVLERNSGNITRTARALGIAITTLKRKIKAYELK
jgi:DNA-binding NtrC family response regulator